MSAKSKEKREAYLEQMRARFQRQPQRMRSRYVARNPERRTHRPRVFTPKGLAHAIRIAAKIASEDRIPNPAFIEALEIAATFFDDLVED